MDRRDLGGARSFLVSLAGLKLGREISLVESLFAIDLLDSQHEHTSPCTSLPLGRSSSCKVYSTSMFRCDLYYNQARVQRDVEPEIIASSLTREFLVTLPLSSYTFEYKWAYSLCALETNESDNSDLYPNHRHIMVSVITLLKTSCLPSVLMEFANWALMTRRGQACAVCELVSSNL